MTLLAWLLASSLLGALLVRVPITAVPSYESGLVLAVLAALAAGHLALRRARARPLVSSLRFGLLEATPGEQVVAETRASLLQGLLVVLLPLSLLVTQSWTLDCRTSAGMGVFLLLTLPALLAGSSLGTLAGSVSRSRGKALLFVAAVALWSASLVVAELLAGPRHVLHSWILGPLSASGLTGFQDTTALPGSAWLHRACSLVLSCLLIAAAALVRSFRDGGPRNHASESVRGDEPDAGWRASRADDATRIAFLLRHSRQATLRTLGTLALVLLPFVVFSDECGLLPGRASLLRALPLAFETPHARLHFARGSPALARVHEIAVQVEFSRDEITRWLGISPAWKVDVFLHRDESSMFELTGARGYLFAAPWNHEVHVLAAGAAMPRALRHELVHVLAADFGAPPLGVSVASGFTEGLATALDEGYSRVPAAHEAIAAAAAAGQVPAARALMSPAGFFAGGMDRAYRASASFVGWLMMTRGPDAVRSAYAWGSLEGATGLSLEELDAQWRHFLEADVHPSAGQAALARERFDPRRSPSVHPVPCARLGRERSEGPAERAALHAAAGDHDTAADLYCEAWTRNHDPLHLLGALAEELNAGRLPDALSLVERALVSPSFQGARRDDLLRRRFRLLAALSRHDEARVAFEDWRSAGLMSWPEELLLEEEALEAPLETSLRYFRAVLSSQAKATADLAALGTSPEPLPAALHEHLLRRQASREPWDPELSVEAEAFAGLRPDCPRLSAARLLDAAGRAEAAGCWDEAEHLHASAAGLPGILPLQDLAARDGVERARFARNLQLPGLPPQPLRPNCRR